ncbi:MAG: hypothetical protein ABUJ98_00315 [Hyphomicrobium sp.]|jgi:hypothetical protein
MAKTLLALAAALLAAMTVLASAAEAGSRKDRGYGGVRGYGGPLGVGPDFGASSKSYSPKRSTKKRTYTRTKKRKARPAKKVDTAKTTPIDVETEDENSAISAASVKTNETIVENAVETETKPKDKPRTTKNVDCKKFFPSVGMTLTVTCE